MHGRYITHINALVHLYQDEPERERQVVVELTELNPSFSFRRERESLDDLGPWEAALRQRREHTLPLFGGRTLCLHFLLIFFFFFFFGLHEGVTRAPPVDEDPQVVMQVSQALKEID